MIREFIIFVLAGFTVSVLIHFITEGREYRAGIHEASQCVSDHWVEYEERTGIMPSVELEKQWYASCTSG